ncbi:MAG: type II secretion system protein [Candidatus Babeliales bacterium]|jgi:prepilin-type N-terminal cleavage/methylation domain-containing protein
MLTGYKNSAFTLLEMMVVIALVAVIAVFTAPRLFRRAPAVEWKNITEDLNNLVLFARHNALEQRKPYRLVFRQGQAHDTVTVEASVDDPDKPGRIKYEQASPDYMATTYKFADAVKLRAVYHGKIEMLAEQRGVAYCAVTADGLVQDVVVHLVRTLDGVESSGTLKMNPFFGTFDFFDGLVRPGT